jgi:glycosyltransferase involved in cell wall biosynthesis
MRVVLIHQAFVPPSEPGGTRHYELARHCVAEGHDFTIVTSDSNYYTGRVSVARRRLVVTQDLDGVRVLRTFTFRTLNKSFFWRIVSFVSFMTTSAWGALRAGPVDVVMGTSPSLFQACSAWLASFIRRRPFLLEIRDLWPEFAIEIGVLKNPVLIAMARWVERFLYARASHILVNSPAYRDYLIDKGLPEEKISLIANGVDPALFDPSATGKKLRQQWNLDDKFIVTYAGALGMANDIPNILRAADRLRDENDVHFILAGEGKDRSVLEELAEQLRLTNVTFLGAVAKSDVGELLAASDACVATLKDIPMFKTTYPNKVFDYMAAGRPIVLGIDGVIRKEVEAAGGGIFVSPGDDEALADAIRSLMSNRPRAKEMGLAGRRYVAEHFDRNQQAKEFVELLQRITQARPGSQSLKVDPHAMECVSDERS